MSERITEPELKQALADNEAAYYSCSAVPWLVAEVRRLRTLIGSLRIGEPAEGVLDISGGIVELVREAREIREEEA